MNLKMWRTRRYPTTKLWNRVNVDGKAALTNQESAKTRKRGRQECSNQPGNREKPKNTILTSHESAETGLGGSQARLTILENR